MFKTLFMALFALFLNGCGGGGGAASTSGSGPASNASTPENSKTFVGYKEPEGQIIAGTSFPTLISVFPECANGACGFSTGSMDSTDALQLKTPDGHQLRLFNPSWTNRSVSWEQKPLTAENGFIYIIVTNTDGTLSNSYKISVTHSNLPDYPASSSTDPRKSYFDLYPPPIASVAVNEDLTRLAISGWMGWSNDTRFLATIDLTNSTVTNAITFQPSSNGFNGYSPRLLYKDQKIVLEAVEDNQLTTSTQYASYIDLYNEDLTVYRSKISGKKYDGAFGIPNVGRDFYSCTTGRCGGALRYNWTDDNTVKSRDVEYKNGILYHVHGLYPGYYIEAIDVTNNTQLWEYQLSNLNAPSNIDTYPAIKVGHVHNAFPGFAVDSQGDVWVPGLYSESGNGGEFTVDKYGASGIVHDSAGMRLNLPWRPVITDIQIDSADNLYILLTGGSEPYIPTYDMFTNGASLYYKVVDFSYLLKYKNGVRQWIKVIDPDYLGLQLKLSTGQVPTSPRTVEQLKVMTEYGLLKDLSISADGDVSVLSGFESAVGYRVGLSYDSNYLGGYIEKPHIMDQIMSGQYFLDNVLLGHSLISENGLIAYQFDRDGSGLYRLWNSGINSNTDVEARSFNWSFNASIPTGLNLTFTDRLVCDFLTGKWVTSATPPGVLLDYASSQNVNSDRFAKLNNVNYREDLAPNNSVATGATCSP